MDNLNQVSESDAIREKANTLKEMIEQHTETSVTAGGHLPPIRKKREKRQIRDKFEEAVARSRMSVDEYRAKLVAEAEAKARDEARIAAEAKAKEEAEAFEALKRQAEAEAKAQSEEIEKLKAQAAADAAAREEELAKARAQYEEDFRRQAEEIARRAREEALTIPNEEQEGKTESEEVSNISDHFEADAESFETDAGHFDNQEEQSASEGSYDLFEPESLNESIAGPDKVSDAPAIEEEPPVFEEEPPVFEEEQPAFEEEPPMFEEEPPVFDDVQTVSEKESVFVETPIFEEQDNAQHYNGEPADEEVQVAYQSEPAEDNAETDSDDFGFAIDTMTKSDAAAELKYDHAAYRTRRKRNDANKTTDIPWVIPGNIQESEPLEEEAPEITPEPQETVQEEPPAVEMPVIEETRSSREERDVLALLDEYDKNGEPDVKKELSADAEFDIIESETPLSEVSDTPHHTSDASFKTDANANVEEDLFSSEDLNDNAVSANTLFDVEEISESSSAEDDLKTPSAKSTSAVSQGVVDDNLFEETIEIPESDDDLFESEPIDVTEDKQPLTENIASVDSLSETKKAFDPSDNTSSDEGETASSAPIESYDDLFEEEPVVDMPADAPDRFDTKPITGKVDTLNSDESVSAPQDVLPAEEPKAKHSTIPMLDDLFDLDDHVSDQKPVTETKETQETVLEDVRPKAKKVDDFDLEMLNIESMSIKRSVVQDTADASTSQKATDHDPNKGDAVVSNVSEAPKKAAVDIRELDSMDDLFSVEDVPEKAEATVKTVTEKIDPVTAADSDSFFESEMISPDSRTAPLPNLDPKAMTPLEKQDISAQSKVSKAFDALFEEDEH